MEAQYHDLLGPSYVLVLAQNFVVTCQDVKKKNGALLSALCQKKKILLSSQHIKPRTHAKITFKSTTETQRDEFMSLLSSQPCVNIGATRMDTSSDVNVLATVQLGLDPSIQDDAPDALPGHEQVELIELQLAPARILRVHGLGGFRGHRPSPLEV